MKKLTPNKPIATWLSICCAMVIFIIFIGGLTRLTESGLSITEWKPITGIIPPLSELDWQAEFEKYKTSPEYKLNNFNMEISGFKFIFWLEFIHRLIGRLAGLVYLLPLFYFLVTTKIEKKDRTSYYLITLLFLAQGFMGWYMVKSGLKDIPHVSHFRLGSHLIIATFIYSLMLWQLLKNTSLPILFSIKENFCGTKTLCATALSILYIQIFLGGLVAGLDAGLVYNSFPLMGESFVPLEVKSGIELNDPVSVQFIHRITSYVLFLIIIVFTFKLFKLGRKKLNQAALALFFVLIFQMLAGILTVVYSVPIILALIHQLGAVMLLSCLIWCYYLLKDV